MVQDLVIALNWFHMRAILRKELCACLITVVYGSCTTLKPLSTSVFSRVTLHALKWGNKPPKRRSRYQDRQRTYQTKELLMGSLIGDVFITVYVSVRVRFLVVIRLL